MYCLRRVTFLFRQESYQRTGLRGATSQSHSCCGARCSPWRFPPASHTDRGHCARSLHLPQAALPRLTLKNPPPLTGFCSKRRNSQRGFQRGKHRISNMISIYKCFPIWSWEGSGKPTKSFSAALSIPLAGCPRTPPKHIDLRYCFTLPR